MKNASPDFLICPVRGATDEEKAWIQSYIGKMEAKGFKIYYPARDTNQEDSIGLRICSDNRAAIRKSGVVRIFYNQGSQGTLFDVGMSFMADKLLYIINPRQDFAGLNNLADWLRFPLEYAYNFPAELKKNAEVYQKAEELKQRILNREVVPINFQGITPEFLLTFGMVFQAEKPILLENLAEVEAQRTEKKSFQNVLLALDAMRRGTKS